jgi:hypothetical protein
MIPSENAKGESSPAVVRTETSCHALTGWPSPGDGRLRRRAHTYEADGRPLLSPLHRWVDDHDAPIREEDEFDEELGRQRALSEPDFVFRPPVPPFDETGRSQVTRRRRRAVSEGLPPRTTSPSRMWAHRSENQPLDESIAPHSAVAASNEGSGSFSLTPPRQQRSSPDVVMDTLPQQTTMAIATTPLNGTQGDQNPPTNNQVDRERLARIRWIRINRRFQFVITMVALLFSLLLFAILICWVVFTSAYILAFDKACDVPIKPYYWLVTFQLLLDVFRSDIMRSLFNWSPSSGSTQRVPCRVIMYNVGYLIFAGLVLRLGLLSVFIFDNTCHKNAPELYNSAAAYVSLSLAAWTTIVCGYLIPFFVVAALLTWNGYNPSAHSETGDPTLGTVFPAAYSSTGAPPGCIDQLHVLRRDELPSRPGECCICIEEFNEQE